MQIHVARDGKEIGVFSLEEVNRQLAAGTLRLTDQAWYEGAAGWITLSTVPGVSAAPASGAPQVSAAAVAGTPAVVAPQRNSELEGHSLAMAGLIIGYVAVAGWLTWILLFGGLAVLQGISESMTKH
jgi:hypothetical protein